MDADREKMNIVIVGHVDHGKSTLVGRLLADTGSLPDGKLDAVRSICARQGKKFEYAFLLDALEAERDQGITIDSARVFFKTALRDIIVIDAPGHIEFLKNMISGAARAEAALLLIDAHEGVRENSRRHGYVLGLLGIRQVTVLVNKMDLVDWSQDVFDRIEAEYRAFLAEVGLVPERFIPIGARDGVNVQARGQAEMPWYDGPTVLDAIDLFRKEPDRAEGALRLPVQDVYKWNREGDERRIVAGRVESGRLKVGDTVVFSPSAKRSTVASIEVFSAPVPSEVAAPNCIGITLTEQIYVERGEVVSHVADAPAVSSRFRANIVWLGRAPLSLGKSYKLKLATTEIQCRLAAIKKVLDASTLDAETGRHEVRRHEVAEVIIEARRAIAFDTIDKMAATARFVLVDGYDVAGGGIILEAVEDALASHRDEVQRRTFEWVGGLVSPEDRAARAGHQAALVLLTGAPNVGKAAIARALERRLFDDGRHTYRLDGKNVFLSVGPNSVQDERGEMVRRYAEVAYLMLDAGHLVVSTSNTFGLADHGVIRTLVAPHAVLHVHVGDDLPEDAPELAIGSLGSYEPPPEAVAEAVGKVVALLAERGLTRAAPTGA